MKKANNSVSLLTLIIFLTSAFIAATAGEAPIMDISSRSEIVVPLVDNAEVRWESAVAISGLSDIGSKRIMPEQPVFRLLADSARLYMKWSAPLDEGAVKTEKRERDGAVYTDESIEWWIDPSCGKDSASVTQFIINPSGSIYDSKGGNPAWDGGWEYESSLHEKVWTGKASISWKDLGISISGGEPVIGMNVCRVSPDRYAASYSPITGTGFNSPKDFATVRFSRQLPSVAVNDLGNPAGGVLDLRLSVRNIGPEKREVVIALNAIKSSEAGLIEEPLRSETLLVEPGASGSFEAKSRFETPEVQKLTLTVFEKGTGKVLYRHGFPVGMYVQKAGPLEIGTQKVLFIDPVMVESTDRILRAFHQPEKLPAPVLKVDKLWEGMTATLPCVIYDKKEKKFRMWYSTFFIPEEFRKKGEVPGDDKLSSRICYAESKDGINWEKPALGLFKFEGQDTNVVLEEMVGWRAVTTVLELPEKAGLGRFVLYRANPDNLYTSDDGIHWKQITNMSYRSDSGSLMYDPKRNRFVWCVKTGGQRYDGTWEGHAVGMAWTGELPEAVSKNAWGKWPPEPVFIPDERDDKDARARGFTNRGFYMWTGWPYGSSYLGWLWRYDRWIPPRPHDGPLYMELVYSADGEKWKRIPERPVILHYGEVGEFDSSHALTCNPPIRVGDELWIYYAGSEATHGWDLDNGIQWKGGRTRHAVGLAKWRLDGFMSLDAIGVGSFTTRSFIFDGKTLSINFKSPNGFVKVGILDENGKTIPGFSPNDCDEIKGDSVRQIVSWKGKSDVSALSRKPVKLRFEMMHAAVYSFQFK